jgi:hypothetical protein
MTAARRPLRGSADFTVVLIPYRTGPTTTPRREHLRPVVLSTALLYASRVEFLAYRISFVRQRQRQPAGQKN